MIEIIIVLYSLGAIIVAATSNPANKLWGDNKSILDPPVQLIIILCALIWPITIFFYWVFVAPRNHD